MPTETAVEYPEAVLTDAQIERRRLDSLDMQKLKEARELPQRKFDGLRYEDDYYASEDARNSYLRPKLNDDEVRVVGPTTEKRFESIQNEMLSMDTFTRFRAYDKRDMEVEDLGDALTDAVRRTFQIEKLDDQKPDMLAEMLSQRAAFAEETEETVTEGHRTYRFPKMRMRSGLCVFPGNITLPSYRWNEQDLYVVYAQGTKESFRPAFGDCANFDAVRPGVGVRRDALSGDPNMRVGLLKEDEVEMLRFVRPREGTVSVYLNGVPMTDADEKLPGGKGTTMAVAVPKSCSPNLLYGRNIVASMKVIQALSDEGIREVVRMFRQKTSPPQGYVGTKIWSRDIFDAGNLTPGIDKNTFTPLVTHDGPQQGEFQYMNWLKSMQDEWAARGSTQLGVTEGKKQTATATIEMQKQAVKMLGLYYISWTNFIRDMSFLRMKSVIRMSSKGGSSALGGIGEEIRRFTLKGADLGDGRTGTSITIIGKGRPTQSELEDMATAEDAAKETGDDVKFRHVNADVLKSPELYFESTSETAPRENDDLHRLMFSDKLEQASAVSMATGRPLNGDKVADDFQRTWRAKDWIGKPQQPQPQPGQEAAQGGQGIGEQATNGITAGVRKPKQPANGNLNAALASPPTAGM
jgi:hypothetical protein